MAGEKDILGQQNSGALGEESIDSSPNISEKIVRAKPVEGVMKYIKDDILEVLLNQSESGEDWNKLNDFQKWLQVFWVEQGHYKITEKGYRELSPLGERQFYEILESATQKTKDTVRHYRTNLSKKQVEDIVKTLCDDNLTIEKLLGNGFIRQKVSIWNDEEVCLTVLKRFFTGIKDIKKLTGDIFRKNSLGGLLQKYESIYELLSICGFVYGCNEMIAFLSNTNLPSDKLYPWELDRAPVGLFNDPVIRQVAIKWLLQRVAKEPKDLNGEDFENNSLGGFLGGYCHASPYEALWKSGYAYSYDHIKELLKEQKFPSDKLYPWELDKAPIGLFNDPVIRQVAIKWLLQRVAKEPKDLNGEDFENNSLGGFLGGYCHASPYEALWKSGYAYSCDDIRALLKEQKFPSDKLYPWELAVAPNGWFEAPSMSEAAVAWLLERNRKSVCELMQDDFINNSLGGLLSEYDSSPYKVLVKAGYTYSFDEIKVFLQIDNYPAKKIYPWELILTPMNFFEDQLMIQAAIKWLLKRIGKAANELSRNDFKINSLGGFLSGYCEGSPYEALVKGGYAHSFDEIEGQTKNGLFSLEKLYPWQMQNPPFYKDKISPEIVDKWKLWYATQMHK